jgi:hypothetical protein
MSESLNSTNLNGHGDETFAPSPIELLRDYPAGQCPINAHQLEVTATVLDNTPLLGEIVPYVGQQAQRMLQGSLYVLHTSPDLFIVIRHSGSRSLPSYALAVLDISDNPIEAGDVAPILDMVFTIQDADSIMQVISEQGYHDGIAENPNITDDHLHVSSRRNPQPLLLGWAAGIAFNRPPPDAATGTPLERMGTIGRTLPPTGPSRTTAPASREHPFYRVDATQMAFRKGGSTLAQKMTDNAIGLTSVAKDCMQKTGLAEAGIRAISAAPDFALYSNTIPGTQHLLSLANHWSVPIWDLRYFIANQYQFPSDFNYIQLAPLTMVYESGGNALDSFQRQLRALGEADKAAYATLFTRVAPTITGFSGALLQRLLYNYLHLVFAITLMCEELQVQFVTVADSFCAIVRDHIIGPSKLTTLLITQAFAIYREAMRDFLLAAANIHSNDDMTHSFDIFSTMVTSMTRVSYLRTLLRTYTDHYTQNAADRTYAADGLTIVVAVTQTAAARPKNARDADQSAAGPSKKKARKNAKSGATSSSAEPATEQASAAKPAASTQPQVPNLCMGFNNVNGCRKESCELEHLCPPRKIGTAANPRWTRLYEYFTRLNTGGTLRHVPTDAFLQGAPWPPVAGGTAGAP